jgi:hypothetical protein
MTIKDAAQSFEGSLMIMRKAKEGWVFGFGVHPNDAPHGILDASLGTRFQCVLFEIDDNEEFIVPEDVQAGRKAVAIAGQMCREKSFQTYMSFKHDHICYEGVPSDGDQESFEENSTASRLRHDLGIESRSDLLRDKDAREKFRELILEFRSATRDG